MSEKRRIVLNTLANGISQLTAMIMAFVFMPLLIRAFGLTDYGLYLLAGSVASYAALLDFGVGTALAKMVAENAAADNHEGIAVLASTALAFYTVIGFAIASLMVLMGVYGGQFFHVNAQGVALLRNLFFIGAVFQLWAWPAATASYVLVGFQKYTFMAKVALGVTLGNVAAIVIVLVTHQGPVFLMGLGGLVGVIGTLFSVSRARRELRGVVVSPFRAKRTALRSIFMFSWAISVIQIAGVIVYQQTDRLVLGIFVGAASISLYEAAGKFQGFIAQLTGFATSAVMPMASHLDAQGRQDSLASLFVRGSKYTVALVTPVVVTLIVLAKPLILRWLGPAFVPQAVNAQILILPQLFMATATLGDSIITGQGNLPKRLPYAIAITIANLVLSLLLVQRLGILGVVLGTSIPYLVDYPFHVRIQLKLVGISASRWLREIVLPAYPLLLIPALVGLGLRETMLMNRLLGVALAGSICVGLYWAAFFWFGLNSAERSEVHSGLRSVVSRIIPKSA